jgi:hypothetical protein
MGIPRVDESLEKLQNVSVRHRLAFSCRIEVLAGMTAPQMNKRFRRGSRGNSGDAASGGL